MKRRLSLVICLSAILVILVTYTFLIPASAYGEGNLLATPTQGVTPWCCAFVVKSTVPFVWVRSSPSSSGEIVAIVFRGAVLTSDLRQAQTSYDGIQWWGYVSGLTYGGWVEMDSLTFAPRVDSPKMTPLAPWVVGSRLRVRTGVSFVWLRSYPSSEAGPLYEILTGGELAVMGNPSADNRQWWWPVRGTVLQEQVGWVEQTSLELVNLNPPTPTTIIVPTITPVSTPGAKSIPATFQSFENGFMIWRADTGAILVLINDGRFLSYGPDYYGLFPDNPVTMPVPPARYRPIMGFGKVWGNIVDVEFGLGWATTPERSYTAMSYPMSSPYISLTLLDGRQAILKPNSTWMLGDGTLPPIGAISLPGPRQTQVPPSIVAPSPTATVQ